MTTKRETSAEMGDLFGGKVAPTPIGQVKATNAKRRNFVRGATITENNAYHRVREHWTKTFADVPDVPRVQEGDACNQRAVIKVLRESAADPDYAYIDEEIICQAISFYRSNPDNMKFHRWKKFSEWLTVESIDKYRAKFRVANDSKLQAANARAELAAHDVERAKIMRHTLVDAAVWAAEKKISTRDYLLRSMSSTKIHHTMREYYESMLPVLDWHARLRGPARAYLAEQAGRIWAADQEERAARQMPPRHSESAAILDGIQLAYLALYSNDPKLREGVR